MTKTATVVGDDDGFVGETDVIDYTIQVTNTGNVTIEGVDLTDTLTDRNGNALNIDTSAWIARDIAPGAKQKFIRGLLYYRANGLNSGSIINTATAVGSSPGTSK